MTEATLTVESKAGSLIITSVTDDGTSIVMTVPEHADDAVAEQHVLNFPAAVDRGLVLFLDKVAEIQAEEPALTGLVSDAVDRRA